MMEFRTIAIPTKVVEHVRATGTAPGYGHPAFTEVATGYGPCRHCLRTFRVGEERRTLFTYDPFFGIGEVPLPGPIFIHAEGCARYDERAGYPEDMLAHAAVMRAYGKEQRLVQEVHVRNGGHVAAVQQLLRRPEVEYVEVRDREAGCFDFRIERA